MSLAGVFDLVGALGFIVATVLAAISITFGKGASRLAAVLMTAAFSVLTFVMVSNTLEHLGITAALDPFEDFVEVVFFPLFAYALYVMSADTQLKTMRSMMHAAQAEHDLVMGIVDSATVAIVMVDTRGCAGFSNTFAEKEFGLYVGPGHERVSHAVIVPAGAPADSIQGAFDVRIVGATIRDERWDAVTETGRIPVRLSATPMYARSGELMGSVVVFIREEPGTTSS